MCCSAQLVSLDGIEVLTHLRDLHAESNRLGCIAALHNLRRLKLLHLFNNCLDDFSACLVTFQVVGPSRARARARLLVYLPCVGIRSVFRRFRCSPTWKWRTTRSERRPSTGARSSCACGSTGSTASCSSETSRQARRPSLGRTPTERRPRRCCMGLLHGRRLRLLHGRRPRRRWGRARAWGCFETRPSTRIQSYLST